MKEKTANNVHDAFVGEAKAYQRLLMSAKKAEQEDLPQIAHLFRAVATAEGVHSRRHFALLESVSDTQTNLEKAFQSENAVNGVYYLKMLQEAEQEGEEVANTVFSQARDVEAEHANLYRRALTDVIAQRQTDYYVCSVMNESRLKNAQSAGQLERPSKKCLRCWKHCRNLSSQRLI